MTRFPLPRVAAVRAALPAAAIIALLGGCREPGRPAGYRFAAGAAYTLRYEASLEAKAESFRGDRPYRAGASARLAFTAAPDSAAGRATLSLSADSVSIHASDRDAQESRYMEERLRRYRAEAVLSRTGQLLSVTEEPDLPPVEFSPVSFGRYLAYGMPALPVEVVAPGSEWTVEQALLDKFHPEARVVKHYRAEAVRQTSEGALLDCRVDMQVFLEEGLGGPGPGSTPDSTRPSLSGRGAAVFNLDRGLPVSSDLELEGRFTSPIQEGVSDSSRVVDLPLILSLKLSLRFSQD